MLYRSPDLGGLGLLNVKARSMAMLINTFMLQAVSPLFPTNYYLNTLYRWHVLDERTVADPGRPPFYSAHFFSVIKDVHLNTPLNVVWISMKQWYQIILERGVTHNSDDLDSPPVLIQSRFEQSEPDNDFSNNYRLCRLFGLSPDQKSFLFKLVQNLLPTKERLHRLGKIPSPSCRFCDCPDDDVEHLLACAQSAEVATPLLACLSGQASTGSLTAKDVVQMKINTSEAWELPAVWLVATSLAFIWEDRLAGKITSLVRFRAELLARVSLLGSTKWKNYTLHNSVVLLNEAINLHFL